MSAQVSNGQLPGVRGKPLSCNFFFKFLLISMDIFVYSKYIFYRKGCSDILQNWFLDM